MMGKSKGEETSVKITTVFIFCYSDPQDSTYDSACVVLIILTLTASSYLSDCCLKYFLIERL